MCFLFRSFCCCISLEVGAQMISIFNTMLASLVILLYGSAALMLELPPARLVFYAGMTAAAGLQLVFGCYLTYGAFKKKPSYMWPWVLLTWALGLALLSFSIAGTVALLCNGGLADSADINYMIFIYGVYALLLFYFATVVNSRRAEILREESATESEDSLLRFR